MPNRTHIPVVDDDAAARAVMRACVAKAGYRVDEAEDAASLRAWPARRSCFAPILVIRVPSGGPSKQPFVQPHIHARARLRHASALADHSNGRERCLSRCYWR